MTIYAIKIALRGISPMIWRRLHIPGRTSIVDLHHIFQLCMGWENESLHRFHIYGKDYGIAYEGGLNFSDDPRSLCLDDFGFDVGDKFTYTYNFFDHWLCDIRVEGIEPATENTDSLPCCMSGSRKHGVDEAAECHALVNLVDKIVYPEPLTTVGDIRILIEAYEGVQFNRQAINNDLRSVFSSHPNASSV